MSTVIAEPATRLQRLAAQQDALQKEIAALRQQEGELNTSLRENYSAIAASTDVAALEELADARQALKSQLVSLETVRQSAEFRLQSLGEETAGVAGVLADLSQKKFNLCDELPRSFAATGSEYVESRQNGPATVRSRQTVREELARVCRQLEGFEK